MLADLRRQEILQKLDLMEVVSAKSLARTMGVSVETIRTDLMHLESDKKLRRVRGGARRIHSSRSGLLLPEREALNRPAKKMIARTACRFIGPRDTLFMDASSTVLAMTEFFPEIETTVLTNANHVVAGLGHRPLVDVICTGGNYEQRSRSYVGMLAEEAVKRFYLKWLFIGADGISSSRGASEINPGQATLKEHLIPLAETVCLLADHTKLEKHSSLFFARPEEIDYLLTDPAADTSILDRFKKLGVRVIICRE